MTGNDHLGHGLSVRGMHGYFAEKNANACVLADVHSLREQTEEAFPGIPYFILGHSMGSFLARQYITRHGAGLAGAVIMGTGSTPLPVLRAGRLLCRLIARFRGWQYRSPLVEWIAGGSFNRRIRPLRTPKDWLTRDTAVVDRYIADPLCMFRFTLNAYDAMFRSMEQMQLPEHLARIPKELPLLLVSGAEDPVGAYGKGVEKAFAEYRKIGMTDVRRKLYPSDRHELLNETDREAVYRDLLEWLLSYTV